MAHSLHNFLQPFVFRPFPNALARSRSFMLFSRSFAFSLLLFFA